MEKQNGLLERVFKLKEHNTDVKTEVVAGFTTFMTMSYILAVNPDILSKAGMEKGAVFTATALSAFIATMLMALYANYPFALAPGMGLNAFFAFTVVTQMGYSWEFALTAVFIEGIIFMLLSLFSVREAIFNAIPINLKKAVSCGIGLFIAMIGLANVGIITKEGATIISLGNLGSPKAIVTILGIIITGVLAARKVKGALFFGIVITTILGAFVGVTQGLKSWPVSVPPSLSPIFFKFEFHNIFSVNMFMVVFTFLFVDLFDTIGTLVGVSTKAGMLDKDGKLPKVGKALMADAVGTTVGACLGTSTVTTFVESASGVAEGGRTGLTSFTTGMLFLFSLLFAPLVLLIPSAATAPVLVVVGVFMMQSVVGIDFEDMTEAIPAFLTIIMMPLAYSIAEGIEWGMISYVVLKVLSGKHKDVSVIMYILAVLFIGKELFKILG